MFIPPSLRCSINQLHNWFQASYFLSTPAPLPWGKCYKPVSPFWQRKMKGELCWMAICKDTLRPGVHLLLLEPPWIRCNLSCLQLWRSDLSLCMIHVAYKTRRVCMLSWFSCVWLFAALWTIACQAPLSMGFSRQESWSELPCPPPGGLPALAGGFFTTSATWEARKTMEIQLKERIYASEL